MDHGFARAKELWELSDGSIFVLREISSLEEMQPFVIKNLEKLSTIGFIDHFKHSHTMKENLFKSLKVIVQNLGKKPFRGYVEIFLDPAFRAAKHEEHQNMAVNAQDFILQLETTYGPNIFKAIVQGHDERFSAELLKYKELNKDGPMDFNYAAMKTDIPGALNPFGVGGPEMTKAPWAK